MMKTLGLMLATISVAIVLIGCVYKMRAQTSYFVDLGVVPLSQFIGDMDTGLESLGFQRLSDESGFSSEEFVTLSYQHEATVRVDAFSENSGQSFIVTCSESGGNFSAVGDELCDGVKSMLESFPVHMKGIDEGF